MRGLGRTLARAGAWARRAPDEPSRAVHGDSRRIRRVAIAAIAISILGPGHPLYAIVQRIVAPSAVTQIGEASEDVRPIGMASVDVTLPAARTAAASAVESPAPKRHRTALIVGINRARGGRPLPGSVTDATNMRDALLMYGFLRDNITMLLDGDATRARILGELDELAARTPRMGVAVFTIATHTRIRGGQNELLTADGLRISASELASRLEAVRAPMWVALPTCYAGGYAKPGIVGRNRIATFASSAGERTYQLGTAGSYLMIKMVREAMLEKHAPDSVEDAFRYAKTTLEKEAPNRVPSMSDGIAGELVLGRIRPPVVREAAKRGEADDAVRWSASSHRGNSSRGSYRSDDDPPSSTPAPSSQSGPRVCGKYKVRC